jgi:hypothetical protein
MDENERCEFEAWASENGMAMHLARGESGQYVSRVTQNYMDCWMASRVGQGALVEALTSQVKALQSDANSYQSGYDAGRAAAKAHADSWRAEAEKLRDCVEDLALSLECEVKARYAGTQEHPAIKRKYDGDMQEVLDARKLLGKEAGHD